MPRTQTSTGTPSWAARYSASMIRSSTMELHLNLIHASRPARWLATSRLDPLQQPAADVVRRHEEPAVVGVHRVAGQDVEQPADVLAQRRVGGQQAEVLVQPGGLRVVVAGAEVDVAAQLVAVVAHDHRDLAVRLQPDQAVDHVHPGPLQFAAPLDVGLLVEPGLDLHQGQHLLAGLRRVDQCVDDRGVAAGPVQGLLDGEHLRIGRRLLQEALDAGAERVVRVVQEDLAARASRRGRRAPRRSPPRRAPCSVCGTNGGCFRSGACPGHRAATGP